MKPERLSSRNLLLKAIEQRQINPADGTLVLEFIDNYGTLHNLSRGSINKYLYALKNLLEMLHERKAAIPSLAEEDVLAAIQYVRRHPEWGEETKGDYWRRLTVFYKWAERRHGPWPGKAKDLLMGEGKFLYKIDKNKVEKKGTLTPEEVLKLIHMEPDLAYKAFFAVLYESGMRAGEAFPLLIRDVEQHNGRGYILHLRASKTDKRPIPLVNFSVTYLAKWLQLHPQKNNPDALLFVNTLGDPLINETANKHLKYLLRQSGIQKRKVTLHSFRHSRAGELANMMTEAQLCKFFGWRIGSKMPATYIRDGALDVRGALLKGYGLQEPERREAPGKGCLHCEHLNPLEAEYCDNCSLPLDRERLEKLKDSVDALRSHDLLKRLLKETRADLIREVVQEIRATNHSVPQERHKKKN